MDGFVAFELQHADGKSLVEMSSELTERIEVVSLAGPFRIFRFDCIIPGGASFAGLHLPFHMLAILISKNKHTFQRISMILD